MRANTIDKVSAKNSTHRLTEENVTKALLKFSGNQAAVSRALGVTRQCVCQFIKRYPALVDLTADLREARIDNAESALDKAIERGEGWAVCFTLKTQGRKRGYVEKLELAGDPNAPLVVNFVEVEIVLARDTRDPTDPSQVIIPTTATPILPATVDPTDAAGIVQRAEAPAELPPGPNESMG